MHVLDKSQFFFKAFHHDLAEFVTYGNNCYQQVVETPYFYISKVGYCDSYSTVDLFFLYYMVYCVIFIKKDLMRSF